MPIVVQTIPTPAALGIPLADAVLACTKIPNARRCSEDELTATITRAYKALHQYLITAGRPHIVRMWNYVPGITEPMPSGGDRYMAFNAGRFAAMLKWYGSADAIVQKAPAASGVGAVGEDLIIHAMALDRPGHSVQNPRQIPATLYSPKFGPRPPCFARATRVGDILLVSGTAAIRGEETVAADLAGQLDITLENLAALINPVGSALADRSSSAPIEPKDGPPGRTLRGLAAYRALRVFLPDPSQQSFIAARLKQAMPHDCQIAYQPAALCRRDLLVEIEGVASDSSTR